MACFQPREAYCNVPYHGFPQTAPGGAGSREGHCRTGLTLACITGGAALPFGEICVSLQSHEVKQPSLAVHLRRHGCRELPTVSLGVKIV